MAIIAFSAIESATWFKIFSETFSIYRSAVIVTFWTHK